MKNLTNAETLSVVKVLASQAGAASKGLAAGKYPIDVTVRVRGVVNKGDDYTQDIVGKIDTWLLLGVALSKLNGATAESIVREAVEIEASKDADALTKQVKDAAKAAIRNLKGTTATDCNGKVTHSLTAEVVVESADEAEAA